MRSPARLLLAVFVGGALGTLARVWLASLTPGLPLGETATLQIPSSGTLHVLDADIIAALMANVLGSLVLGVVAGAHWPPRRALLRAALGPGFCGGFTTFSLIALALAAAFSTSVWAVLAFVLGTVGGILAIVVGKALGRRISPEPGAGGPASLGNDGLGGPGPSFPAHDTFGPSGETGPAASAGGAR